MTNKEIGDIMSPSDAGRYPAIEARRKQMKETEKRLRQWLADPANIQASRPALFPESDFPDVVLRQPFVTRNGHEISIQQGASHYCNVDQVEMWYCPHRPMLDEYGTGEDPYGWVPISVAADYIEALEGESK